MKFVMIGVIHDANIGDGVIAETFASLLGGNGYESYNSRIDDVYKHRGRHISKMFIIPSRGRLQS